jgi:hypothetical protein
MRGALSGLSFGTAVRRRVSRIRLSSLRRRVGRSRLGGIGSRTLRVPLGGFGGRLWRPDIGLHFRRFATFRRVETGRPAHGTGSRESGSPAGLGVVGAAAGTPAVQLPGPLRSSGARSTCVTHELTEVDRAAPELTEIDRGAPELTEIDRDAPEPTEVDHLPPGSPGARSGGGDPVVLWRNVAKRRKCNPIPARHRRAQSSRAARGACASQFRNKMTGAPPTQTHPWQFDPRQIRHPVTR